VKAPLCAGGPPVPASPLPNRFGDYELLDELGRGGMGRVYRTRQLSLDRIVALKVISTGEMASPNLVERFRTEAEAAASLDHPNIVSIYEVGDYDGWNFFSMRLVEGQTLTQALAAGPLPFERAGKLLATLARAIQQAHERGVLHRDLKPGNILLDATGAPHVADFGLAKFTQRQSDLTLTHTALGTPAYMFPEQAAGRVKEITTAADIYGLGAVMFEMLTGLPPFAGETPMAIARQVIEAEPRAPSAVNPAVPLDLAVICLKCLEKDPARCYPSATALADDLERWLRHEPIRARPNTPVERLAKLMRRYPARTGLVLTALLALVAVAVVSSVMTVRLRVAKSETDLANLQLSKNLRELELQKAEELAGAGQPADALAMFARFLRQVPNDPLVASRIVSMLSLHSYALPIGQPLQHQAGVVVVRFNPKGDRLDRHFLPGRPAHRNRLRRPNGANLGRLHRSTGECADAPHQRCLVRRIQLERPLCGHRLRRRDRSRVGWRDRRPGFAPAAPSAGFCLVPSLLQSGCFPRAHGLRRRHRALVGRSHRPAGQRADAARRHRGPRPILSGRTPGRDRIT